MTQDEPDTCRICSAPAEPDAPLFHPCRCSGTIRYIHQDCLTTWLAHSKKKACDVCKYQYAFTKVYSENMPRQIPFILFLRKFAQKTFWAIVLAIRGLMVATIWLAFLPYVTVWTWRFYFIMGDNIAWWIYDHPRPAPTPLFHAYFSNLTFNDDRNQTSSPDRTFLDLVTSYPVWRALSADIFTGQIIASLIILVFLGIFLLREWIIQNARPGVFEEENDLDIDGQDGIVADVEPVAVPEEAAADPVLAANEPIGDDPTEERERDFIPEHTPLDPDVEDHPSDSIGRGADMKLTGSPVLVQEGDSNIRLAESRKEDEEDEDLFAFTYERPDSPPATSEPYSFAKRMEEINRNIQPSRTSRKSLAPISIEPSEAGPSGSQPHSRPRSHVSPTGSPDSSEGRTDVSPSVNAAGPSSIAVEAPYTGQSNTESTSSEGSESEYQFNHDSLDSEGDSISSSVPTVGSEFRDDLDEYFPELEEEDRPGPIRVAELLNNEEQVDDAVEEAENQEAVEAPENQDNINDDDVDGALEAVGMRGPLTTVFQNAALMIFVLDTTIGVAVWLPFTIGKTIALLSLEPIRILRLLQWPIRIIRYATDPLVDLLSLSVFRVVQIFAGIFGVSMSGDAGQAPSPYNLTSTKLFFESGFLGLFTQAADGRSSAIARGIEHMADSPVGQLLEPFFARFGRRVRLNAAWLKAGWMELANGDATINRCFAIALGYLIDGLLLAIYLNVLNVGNVQSAGRAIRNAIKQQLVVLKVAAFILIELVLFPLGCGVMLDFCTLRLLPDATVQSRLSFFAYAPVTASFYHWMIGTMFMYQFALFLGGCRKIMRPGALWFIKDPQDQSFHPVRDILDRPTLIQIRKLFLSALMYSFVVALGMGGLVTCVRLWGKLLLPLRWNLRKPLFDVPIDLLFLHIVIPPTVKYFRPRKFAFTLAKAYWRWASKRLSLTSYMFGGMHPDEMRSSGDVHLRLLSALGLRAAEEGTDDDASPCVDGTYRRVPAQDNISLPQEIRATVPVDKDGKPLDDAGKRLIELQDSEAEKANRRASDDYTVIYLPPHSKERVILFVICLWIAGSSAFVASLAIPTLLGRAVFAVTFHRVVHDGYSFIVGFYLLWGCYRVGLLLDHFDKRRQRSSNRHSGLKYAVYAFKRSMLWIGNAVWVAFWFGIVIPTLLALVIEVYVVHPLRIIFKPDLILKIRIFDSWAVGLLYTKMAISTMRLRPETRIDTAIREMRQRGWRDLNAVQVTLDIIAPVVAGLIGMLLLPIMLVLGLQQILPTKISSNSLCQSPPFALLNVSLLSAGEHYLRALSCPSIAVLYVYPGIFVFAAGARMYGTLQSVLAAWAQQIRDSEFLVELRLRNLDPPDQKTEHETNHPPLSSQVHALR